MDCSDIVYKIMCQRLDQLIYGRKCVDTSADINELEKRIRDNVEISFMFNHYLEIIGSEFFCVKDYLNEICKSINIDIDIGEIDKFAKLVGLDEENEDEDISGN